MDIEKQITCLKDHRTFCHQCQVLTDDIEKSLRLVPKLLFLKEVAIEIQTMLGDGGFIDIGGDNAAAAWLATYSRFKVALAALDAGEGGT